jgi:hypothetical protein
MRLKDKALNFTCKQGSTFSRRLVYKINRVVVNLDGFTARMQIRESHTSPNTIASLTVGNGIAIDAQHGQITITLTAGQTTTLIAGTYVYDIEIESANGVIDRILEGKFIVTPEVTR